ncbi:hypothetical protein NVP1029O_24 [Vibrio phage 1.029.O._10N.261.55.A7]|nr:hypothetical protein NVP1029O_24 [Vibrio phage 1.029.O._10N.261.55.A7]
MAIAIDTFNKLRGVAYEGQVSDINAARIDSGPNLGAASIKFGRFVAASGAGDGVANVGASTTAADIVGVAVRTPAWENAATGQPAYEQKDIVSSLKSGRISVIAQGGCTRGGNVFVNIKGALEVGSVSGTTSADRIELTGVKFAQTVADGEFVELVLDGNIVTG